MPGPNGTAATVETVLYVLANAGRTFAMIDVQMTNAIVAREGIVLTAEQDALLRGVAAFQLCVTLVLNHDAQPPIPEPKKAAPAKKAAPRKKTPA
jgi:hypothetical protein